MKTNNKYVECPNCLGTGLEYDPETDSEIKCKICKGKGRVKEEYKDSYNPSPFEELNYEEDE